MKKSKRYIIQALIILILLNTGSCRYQKELAVKGNDVPVKSQAKNKYSSFRPGTHLNDDNDDLVNAHGGGILYSKSKYYWFGEKRGKNASEGVNVYSSKDLYNWKFENVALALEEDTASEITKGCVMERPKVIFNKATNKYVMWFHLELKGKGYNAARAAVAVSNNITGPYKFLKSFRPNGNMSRDMTLFLDDDNSAYQIYSSRDNYDLRIVKLSGDFLSATTDDRLMFSKHREAPALFKYQNKYYLITSGCTGWAPNKADLHVATSIWGPWKPVNDNPMTGPNADSTFGAQSTFVQQVIGKKDAFIFIADKWNPKNLKDSRYLWLPLQFKNDEPYIRWMDQWDLSFFTTK